MNATISGTRSSHSGPSFGPTYYVESDGTTLYRGTNRAAAIRAYRRAGGSEERAIAAADRQADAIDSATR